MTNWILCPVRNCLHLTRAAMKTFLAQDIGDIRVLLIDNDSDDGTLAWARMLYPQVLAYPKMKPWSVAKSWNWGLELIFENHEYALVVNNDVELRPDTYRWLTEDGGGFVTAVGVTEKEKLLPDNIKLSDRTIQEDRDPDPEAKRPHPDFSCFLIRKEIREKVGPFNENFKIAFFEDNEYHVRMHRKGIRAYCIDLPFYHPGSGTIDNATDEEKHKIAKAAGENREYFRSLFGCYPATSEYEELFDESEFGAGY